MNWVAFVATLPPVAASGIVGSVFFKNECISDDYPGECAFALGILLVVLLGLLTTGATIAIGLTSIRGHRTVARGILAGLGIGLVVALSGCAAVLGTVPPWHSDRAT